MKAAGGPLFPLIPLENNGYNSKSHFLPSGMKCLTMLETKVLIDWITYPPGTSQQYFVPLAKKSCIDFFTKTFIMNGWKDKKVV